VAFTTCCAITSNGVPSTETLIVAFTVGVIDTDLGAERPLIIACTPNVDMRPCGRIGAALEWWFSVLLRCEYGMSRGLGALQRWLVKHLPPASDQPNVDAMASVASVTRLAQRYYGTGMPTDGQLQSVRHALRRLEEQGLAQRWTIQLPLRGRPSFWTRPKR
jgi:hypothetical protein